MLCGENRIWSFLAIFLVGLTAVVTAEQIDDETLGLDELAAIPKAEGAPVAGEGSRLAWVQNDRGMRNLYVAEPPGYAPSKLTDYIDDDGIVISNVMFSPDGRWLVYTRGGPPNNRGERHNPRSFPDPVQRTLWKISVEGGIPIPIGEGGFGSLTFAPEGERLFYSKGREVWAIPFEEPYTPKRLFTIRGSASDFVVSPDGSKLAFVSNRGMYGRGGYSFVGVYALGERSVTYLFPNVEYDGPPVWSPDGKRVAFLRIPREPKSYRFTDFRDVVPWSIVVADAETGKGDIIWTADRGPGSYFWGLGGPSPLLWTSDDRLVFAWEKTDWNQLYAVPVMGGEAVLLTPGDLEVRSATLSKDRKKILFSSNQDDIERLHIWLLTVGEDKPTRVTRGDGVENLPVFLDDSEPTVLLRWWCVPRWETALRSVPISMRVNLPILISSSPRSFISRRRMA